MCCRDLVQRQLNAVTYGIISIATSHRIHPPPLGYGSSVNLPSEHRLCKLENLITFATITQNSSAPLSLIFIDVLSAYRDMTLWCWDLNFLPYIRHRLSAVALYKMGHNRIVRSLVKFWCLIFNKVKVNVVEAFRMRILICIWDRGFYVLSKTYSWIKRC